MARSGLASACAAALVLCFTLLSGCDGAEYCREVGAASFDSSRLRTVSIRYRLSMQACWNSCNSNSACETATYSLKFGTCWQKNGDRRTRWNPKTRKSVGSTLAVLSTCESGCICRGTGAQTSRSRTTTTSSSSNVAADTSNSSSSSSGKYIDQHWVHLPAFFKGGLRMTCRKHGRKSAWDCEELAWKLYGNNAIYAQSGGDGNQCFTCKSGGSTDVPNINVNGHDINRVWCKNKQFQNAWHAYRGSADKGPTPCSHVGDGDSFKWWVDDDGNRIRQRSAYKGEHSL